MNITKSPLITGLEELYSNIGNTWIKNNSLVLNYARPTGISIGGYIALAISRKRATKVPGDLDFFTDSLKEAEDFVNKITKFLNNRKNTYYNIRINNQTSHCLEGVNRQL